MELNPNAWQFVFFKELVLVSLLFSTSDYQDLDEHKTSQHPSGVFNLRQIRARSRLEGSRSAGGCGWNGLDMGARPGAEQRARPQDSLKTGDLWGASEQNVTEPLWHLHHISVSSSSHLKDSSKEKLQQSIIHN